MADKLTKDQIALFLEVFSHFDKDGNGTISTEELEDVMRNVGENPTKAGLEALMSEFDTDRNGQINFPEFLNMMAKIMIEQESEKEIREAFQVLDSDQNGFVTAVELRKFIYSLNLKGKPSWEQVNEIMRKADIDGDGRLNYDEFVKLWRSEFSH